MQNMPQPEGLPPQISELMAVCKKALSHTRDKIVKQELERAKRAASLSISSGPTPY